MVLQKSKSFENRQNLKTGIAISGFILRGGRLNETNNYLEEENIREFEYSFPICNLICQKKMAKTEIKSVKKKNKTKQINEFLFVLGKFHFVFIRNVR